MVIKTEVYPGMIYQVQQKYSLDGYPSNDQYGHGHVSSGMHMSTNPCITNTPVLKPSNGYTEHHTDRFDSYKPHSKPSGGYTDHHMERFDSYKPHSKPSGGYTEHHTERLDSYKPHSKPSGVYTEHYTDRFDSYKPQLKPSEHHTMKTDHSSHNTNGHVQFAKCETSKYNSGQSNHHGTANSGYGSGYGPYEANHGAQVPFGGNRVESRYEYSSSANPMVHHNGGRDSYQGGWQIMSVDD